jgi:hypothetical protein
LPVFIIDFFSLGLDILLQTGKFANLEDVTQEFVQEQPLHSQYAIALALRERDLHHGLTLKLLKDVHLNYDDILAKITPSVFVFLCLFLNRFFIVNLESAFLSLAQETKTWFHFFSYSSSKKESERG